MNARTFTLQLYKPIVMRSPHRHTCPRCARTYDCMVDHVMDAVMPVCSKCQESLTNQSARGFRFR